MDIAKLHQEAERWFRQAEDDLSAASALSVAHKYAQACFLAQQAAEKSIKATGFLLDIRSRNSSCTQLIQYLPEDERRLFSSVADDAEALDKLYISTRYPNTLAELTPAEEFTRREADAAIASAQKILNCAEKRIFGVFAKQEEAEDQSADHG